jgi:AraC family transcriptional regulator
MRTVITLCTVDHPATRDKERPLATASISYAARLDRVVDHIMQHPDASSDQAALSDIASLPAAYWQRIYHAMRGETVGETVRRLRQGGPRVRPEGLESIAGAGWSVEIRRIPALGLISQLHEGPRLTRGPVFHSLLNRAMAGNLLVGAPRIFAVCLDDPTAAPADGWRWRAGITGRDAGRIDPPLERTEAFGGDYAVLRHRGPYADLWAAEVWLFGTWLPASGREAAETPLIAEYLNSPLDTPPDKLLTDIFMPLEPAWGS